MQDESQAPEAKIEERQGFFKRMDNQSKRFWESNKKMLSMWGYISEGIFGVIFGIVALVIVNVFYDELKFLTDDFDIVLLLLNISMVVGILLNFALIILHYGWFKALSSVINNVFSFIVILVMLLVSPFDFTGKWDFFDTLLPIVLVLLLIALVIGTITESVKLFKAIWGAWAN